MIEGSSSICNCQKTDKEKHHEIHDSYQYKQLPKMQAYVLTPYNAMMFLETSLQNLGAKANSGHNCVDIKQDIANFLSCIRFFYQNNFAGLEIEKALQISLFQADVDNKLLELCKNYLVSTNFREMSASKLLGAMLCSTLNINSYPDIVKICIDAIPRHNFYDFNLGFFIRKSLDVSLNHEPILNLCVQYINTTDITHASLIGALKQLHDTNLNTDMLATVLNVINNLHPAVLLDPDIDHIAPICEFTKNKNLQWSDQVTLEMMKHFKTYGTSLKTAVIKVQKYIDIPCTKIDSRTHNMDVLCKFAALLHFAEELDQRPGKTYDHVTPDLRDAIIKIAWKIFETDKTLYDNLRDPVIDVWKVFEKFLPEEQINNMKHLTLERDLLTSYINDELYNINGYLESIQTDTQHNTSISNQLVENKLTNMQQDLLGEDPNLHSPDNI